MPPSVLDDLGVVPSYYLRYFYLHDAVVAEQREGTAPGRPRSRRSRTSCCELYADPALDTKPELLGQRGGAFYSEAAVALLASLLGDTGGRAGRQRAQRRHPAASSPTTR